MKKQIRRFEKWGDDEFHREMLEDLKHMRQWTRNIPPPSTPKRYDPNQPLFDPRDILGQMDDDLDDDA